MLHYAVIMAGGSGTRLWPLSREKRPKQTLRLIGGESMFQHAVSRLLPLFPLNQIMVVTKQDHKEILQAQVKELKDSQFIIEPEGRGTAPAIGLAAIHLHRRDPQAVMAVLTADHFIADTSKFLQVIRAAEKVACQDFLVMLGITPTSPSTAFGYIKQGQSLNSVEGFPVYQVGGFTEKPHQEAAARMVSAGIYSWNSGMFIWRVSRILVEFQKQMPIFYEKLMQIEATLGTADYSAVLNHIWSEVPRQTIDYGIMEGAEKAAVIPVEMGWMDIGSWSSLIGLLPEDEQRNTIAGNHIGIDTQDSLILGGNRMVATIGLKEVVIIDTDDAILICAKGHEQRVKEMVEILKSKNRTDLL